MVRCGCRAIGSLRAKIRSSACRDWQFDAASYRRGPLPLAWALELYTSNSCTHRVFLGSLMVQTHTVASHAEPNDALDTFVSTYQKVVVKANNRPRRAYRVRNRRSNSSSNERSLCVECQPISTVNDYFIYLTSRQILDRRKRCYVQRDALRRRSSRRTRNRKYQCGDHQGKVQLHMASVARGEATVVVIAIFVRIGLERLPRTEAGCRLYLADFRDPLIPFDFEEGRIRRTENEAWLPSINQEAVVTTIRCLVSAVRMRVGYCNRIIWNREVMHAAAGSSRWLPASRSRQSLRRSWRTWSVRRRSSASPSCRSDHG